MDFFIQRKDRQKGVIGSPFYCDLSGVCLLFLGMEQPTPSGKSPGGGRRRLHVFYSGFLLN